MVEVIICMVVLLVEYIGFLVVFKIVELCLWVGGVVDVVSVFEGSLVCKG